MKYFLTSNPTSFDKLNDSNSFVINLKNSLPEKVRLLFICSDPDIHDKTEKYGNEIKKCFLNSGINIVKFSILDGINRNDANYLINESDCIFLAGGHVPTQNKFFIDIDLKEILEKCSNKVVVGFSAGAMNCASIVYAQPELKGEAISKYYKRFITGLGITNINLLPHFNEIKNETLDGLRIVEDITFKDSIGKEFIAINDGSYIYGDGHKEILYGEGFLIKNGEIEKICSNEQVYTIL